MPDRRAVRSLPLMKADVGIGVGGDALVTVMPVTLMLANVSLTPRADAVFAGRTRRAAAAARWASAARRVAGC